MSERTEADVDREYLDKLERRLRSANKSDKPRDIVRQLEQLRNYQVSQLVSGAVAVEACAVESVESSWLRRKVLPESVALNKEELQELVKNDSIGVEQPKNELLARMDATMDPKTQATEWELSHYAPIPFCNTYGLHLLGGTQPLVVDIAGVAHWVGGEPDGDVETVDLKPHVMDGWKERGEMAENSSLPSLELVASDISYSVSDQSSLVYLATCWVVYDRLFVPESYFAGFFRFSGRTTCELWRRIELPNAPTYTRLTTTSPMDTSHLYWLIFSHNRSIQAFSIDAEAHQVAAVENIGDVFPVLEIGSCPGSAIRSNCWIARGYRFSTVGYDTGYVIASVCTMTEGIIVDRKCTKFRGPISVLRLMTHDNGMGDSDDGGNTDDDPIRTLVLVSSTLGPAAIWSLTLKDETLSWEMLCELCDSEAYDTVICAAFSHDFIFIGTHAEHVLVYPRASSKNATEVHPITVLCTSSPVLSIANGGRGENSLAVLSNKGLHQYRLLRHEQNDG